MFKEEQIIVNLESWLTDWWENHSLKINDPELLSLKVEFVEHESWNLTWFQHETFDVGQTDKEAIDSFESFVTRKENSKEDINYLMGAEDRWRWRGVTLGVKIAKNKV